MRGMYVPSDARLFPHLTVRETISLADIHDRNLNEINGHWKDLLARKCSELSGGERQSLLIEASFLTLKEI